MSPILRLNPGFSLVLRLNRRRCRVTPEERPLPRDMRTLLMAGNLTILAAQAD